MIENIETIKKTHLKAPRSSGGKEFAKLEKHKGMLYKQRVGKLQVKI